MVAQPRRLLERDCVMARPLSDSCPNGAEHISPRATPWGSCDAPPQHPNRRAPTPKPARLHIHLPCPGCIPTIRVPDAYPPSHPQGCTPGWYALTLWGTWNPVLMAAQTRRLLERDCGMDRSFTASSPSGAACDNPGRRPGIHATHRPNPQTGAPQPPNRRVPKRQRRLSEGSAQAA